MNSQRIGTDLQEAARRAARRIHKCSYDTCQRFQQIIAIILEELSRPVAGEPKMCPSCKQPLPHFLTSSCVVNMVSGDSGAEKQP